MTRRALFLLSVFAACAPARLDSFLYDPLPAPAGGYTLSTDVIPAHEDLHVATPDGQTLHVVFVASSGRRPDVTVVYFHGQSSNIGTSWKRMEYLYPLGYNLAKIPHVPAPYLALHGTADPYVQVRYSRQLTEAHAAAGFATQLVLVPGADHGNVPETLTLEAYRSTLSAFVESALPPPAAATTTSSASMR